MFRHNIKTLLTLTAFIAVSLSFILIVKGAIKARVLACVNHPNGTRLLVTQHFNYQPELFTTSLYFDDGDGTWRWYYFDHQDSYWHSADAIISDNKIRITSEYRSLEFDTSTGECVTSHSGRIRRHAKSNTIKMLPSGIDLSTNPNRAAG
ncbi:hypothetical protein OAG71_00545 [bacterium]|nr:hypothetical protein [bacterium]